MPFTEIPTEQVQNIGEIQLIRLIKKWLGSVNPPAPNGMGDDCAITEAGQTRQIITTDTLSYGQHFDSTVSARDAGSKLIKRNLSDIAAMGGHPQHAVLALLCGADTSIDWLESFFKGIRESAQHYDLKIVGGDVSALETRQFSAVVTLVGLIEQTKLRTGASIGDAIYVTGSLGGSILGKHYHFKPRLGEGQWLVQQSDCTALMDLTDGLAKDLTHLLPESSAAAIALNQVPVSNDARLLAEQTGCDPFEHVFCDGEDYELLFTASKDCDLSAFERAWAQTFPQLQLSRIGTIIATDLPNTPLLDAVSNEAFPWSQGFQHLKNA
ncbi:MAG: thiamine-phosphate kinase [Lentimonas sp.]